jgi:ketosteroid isomerase-like protein
VNAGYDSYKESRALVERLFGIARGGLSVLPDSSEWAEMRREAESLFADDVQLATRDGTLYGPQRIFDDFAVQLKGYTLTLDLRQLFGSSDGSVVAVWKFTRMSRENPDDHFWNLAAAVYRVRAGKIVFFEGYPNARRACEKLGIDPALIE